VQDDSYFVRGSACHRHELSELVIGDLYRFPENQIPIYSDFLGELVFIAV